MAEDFSKKPIKELIGFLTAGQAWALLVVVATLLIGSFTLGSWSMKLQNTAGSSTDNRQIWMIIKRVEILQFNSFETKDRIRVYVSVNGDQPYIAFPIDGEAWIHHMVKKPPEVKFPLPQYSESYRLSFTASMSAGGFPPNFSIVSSRFDVKIPQANLPLFNESAFLFAPESKGEAALKVIFSVIRE